MTTATATRIAVNLTDHELVTTRANLVTTITNHSISIAAIDDEIDRRRDTGNDGDCAIFGHDLDGLHCTQCGVCA